MKFFATFCIALTVSGMCAINSLPVSAKDNSADAAKHEEKSAGEANKANEEASKGHSRRAGHEAKKAERDQEKAAKDAGK